MDGLNDYWDFDLSAPRRNVFDICTVILSWLQSNYEVYTFD